MMTINPCAGLGRFFGGGSFAQGVFIGGGPGPTVRKLTKDGIPYCAACGTFCGGQSNCLRLCRRVCVPETPPRVQGGGSTAIIQPVVRTMVL